MMMNPKVIAMMRLQKCPMCGARALECYPGYSTCHECDYFSERQKLPSAPRAAPYPFRGLFDHSGDLFTEEDHEIIRRALLSIPEREKQVVTLHFWKRRKKRQIAHALGIPVERVDQILESAFVRLRALCLENPKFSRVLEKIEEVAA